MFRKTLPLLLCLAVASTLSAQTVRTFVSTTGSDVNPCSKAAPCRTFNVAITAVDPEGEVVALDSGGYGAALISKAVTVLAPPGLHAAIAPTLGFALEVDTTGEVILRNLYLNSQGATDGVVVLRGPRTYLEGVVINGFQFGVVHTPASLNDKLLLNHVTLRNNNVGLDAQAGAVTATWSTFGGGSGFGIDVHAGARVEVSDSVITGNSDIGARSIGDIDVSSRLAINHCTITENSVGLAADGTTNNNPGTIWVSDSLISGNFTGVSAGANSRVIIVGNRITLNTNGLDNTIPVETDATNSIRGNVTDVTNPAPTGFVPFAHN